MPDCNMFNPFQGNRLQSRDDVQNLLLDLFTPLIDAFSPGCARVRLEETAACFVRESADLEGFARPLWGIVPFAYGGGEFPYWDIYRKGLANGTDPDGKEYWGSPVNKEQRMVEMAAIGYALALVPEHIWEPLDDTAKKNVLNYLLTMRQLEFNSNNWMFFRVLIDLGLKGICYTVEDDLSERYLEKIDAMYLQDGWYDDGERLAIDHYNGFAIHFYSLIYAKVCKKTDPARSARFVERSHQFAKEYIRWSDDQGACLPIGRSLTYRFATSCFWGALAMEGSDVPGLDWGVIKGVYMRNLRWWAQRPISRFKTNLLTVGYGYVQPYMYETYNSAQSPYWAMKVFSALAVDASHPFWTVDEKPFPFTNTETMLIQPQMYVTNTPGNTIVLSSGITQNDFVTNVADKYAKFAYSTRFGFCVSEGAYVKPWDNMIAFSSDGGLSYSGRYRSNSRWFGDGLGLYSVWAPKLIPTGVKIETWLVPHGAWHFRLHRITSTKNLKAIEGGFAIEDLESKSISQDNQFTVYNKLGDCSVIIDSNRQPKMVTPDPNLNVLHPLVVVPQLACDIKIGVTTLSAVYYAGSLPVPEFENSLSSLNELENLMLTN